MTLVVKERVWGLCGTLGILQGSLMIQVGRRYLLDLVSGDKDSVSDVCGLSSWLRQGQGCSVICSTCLVPASTADLSLGSACPSMSISALEILPCSARGYWPPCCGYNSLPGRLSGSSFGYLSCSGSFHDP